MNGERQPLLTSEPVKFEKSAVEVQDFTKTIDRFREICGIYLKWSKKEPEDHTICDLLDLGTLGIWLIMPKNLPERYVDRYKLKQDWWFPANS